jgi:uncharacterized peroxidase-related enzyme
MFVETIGEDEARGEVAEVYARERERVGHVANYARAFSLRPEVYTAWRGLVQAIMAPADRRRFELATLAAAKERRSSYCSLAHGKVLADGFYSPAEVAALPRGLDEADAAIMAFAEKAAADARAISQDDVDRLRALGLEEHEIVDLVLAVAARLFFSTVLDALGAEPDADYNELAPELRDALTVGRPIAGS